MDPEATITKAYAPTTKIVLKPSNTLGVEYLKPFSLSQAYSQLLQSQTYFTSNP